jgi:tRNA nucleotidyltransferase (CCA-adding enzyme)
MALLTSLRRFYCMCKGRDDMKHRAVPRKLPTKQTPVVRPPATSVSLAEHCQDHLSEEVQQVLSVAARVGNELGVRVYAVGGFVRDILLGVQNDDLDLTVEGDGPTFARHLASALSGVSKGPSAFGTAVVLCELGHKIDVATARRESYEHPAALPTVEPGTIHDDLFRRDFSINTLAFALNGPEAFLLLDWFGGNADLTDGVIRVLHNRSFRDDPTRMFRAIRLEQRFGFVLHPHTLRLLHRAVEKRWTEQLSGARLWRELRLILEGESPAHGLKRLDDVGLLRQIDPELSVPPARLDLLTRVMAARLEVAELAPGMTEPVWLPYWAALVQDLPPASVQRACRRLTLSPRITAELISGLAAIENTCQRLRQDDALRPSAVVAMLRPLSIALLPLLLGRCAVMQVHESVRQYLTTWRHIRTSLTGDDLKRLGVPQGRHIGQLLTLVLAAKLDDQAPTREAEEALILNALRHIETEASRPEQRIT